MLNLTIACDLCEAESGFHVNGEPSGVIGARSVADVRDVLRGAGWARRFHRAVGRMVDLCPKCDERERGVAMIEATAYCDGCRKRSHVTVAAVDDRFHPKSIAGIREVMAGRGWTSRHDSGWRRMIDLCPKCANEEQWKDKQ